jgi:hypothetical protein
VLVIWGFFLPKFTNLGKKKNARCEMAGINYFNYIPDLLALFEQACELVKIRKTL